MINTRKISKAIGLAVTAVLLSAVLGTSASGVVTSSPGINKSSTVSVSQPVRVTQFSPGTSSGAGLLEWLPVAGATEYRIYKTGSIRPSWRLFAITPKTVTNRKIADKPGAIAIYKVTALVNYKEVLVGSFTYSPKR